MRLLAPSSLMPHSAAIAQRLNHSESHVRLAELRTLTMLAPSDLFRHAAAIANRILSDLNPLVRDSATAVMGQALPSSSRRWCGEGVVLGMAYVWCFELH